jgi:serine/threonine protein kinase
MATHERIHELLEQWGDLRKGGKDVTAEELCRDCPDLTEQLRKRIKALKATEWMELPLDEDAPDQDKTIHGPEDFGLPPMLGRYRLEKLVGIGGFGQVWRGFDPELQRPVAIKIARPDKAPSVQQAKAFLAEARKVAQLKHPGIVPVYDVGQEAGRFYIVSQFVEGGSLAEQIAKCRLKHQEAVRIVAEVADILHYAHRQGFIHRDIKPANILLDKGGGVFVTDFGIAFREGELPQGTGGTTGTLAYMSPEQLQSGSIAVDARTDVYSLGVLLYELLTGRLPFPASSPVALRDEILSGKPKPPRAIDDTIPTQLERICLKASAKEPANRYSTAKDFAAALRDAVGEPRPQRWKRYALFTAIAVLPAIAVGIWFLHGHQEAERTKAAVVRSTQDRVAEVQDKLAKSFGITINGQPVQPTSQRTGASSERPLRLAITELSVDLTGRPVTLEDFTVLDNQLLLRRLTLADTPTTDEFLNHLERNSSLEELNLRGTLVTDAALERLSRFPLLQRLDLSNTAITDAGLKHLTDMELRNLNLCGTKVTDTGIKNLTVPRGTGECLNALDLSGTAVTDACVQYLRQMPRLDKLTLLRTKITEEAVRTLREALPKCKIESSFARASPGKP